VAAGGRGRIRHGTFAVYVWRSVRADGDTKTEKSRRTLEIPSEAAEALRDHDSAGRATARDDQGCHNHEHDLHQARGAPDRMTLWLPVWLP